LDGLVIRSSINGIGMTSQRTRDRMLARLREQGVKDEVTLAAMGEIPRHIFHCQLALAKLSHSLTPLLE
jgi:protein-L-isoaspartate O-methyltransferase